MLSARIISLALAALTGGCTAVGFTIPNPVDNGGGGANIADTAKVDTVARFSSNVKWVASAEELAALVLAPGDTVVWRNGTYADQTVELNANGTEAAPVVLMAEKSGEVIFTGSSWLQVGGSRTVVSGFWWQNPSEVSGRAVVTLRSSYNMLRNCAITGFGCQTDAATDYKWVSLFGTGHTVAGCHFADKRNMGTLLVVWLDNSSTARHTVANNYFSRPVSILDSSGSSLNGQETIRIGTSDYSLREASCTVSGNVFHRCNGETETISNKSCGNLYEGNLFTECQGTLTLRHGNGCTVRGNYFLGNKVSDTGGIRIIGENHTVENNYLEKLRGTGYKAALCMVRGIASTPLNGYAQVKNAVVRGNIIYGCRYSMHLNYASSPSVQTEPVASSIIAENTVYCTSDSDYAVYMYNSPTPEINWSDNTIYGGSQSGATLPTADAAPTIDSVSEIVAAISASAGTDWDNIFK